MEAADHKMVTGSNKFIQNSKYFFPLLSLHMANIKVILTLEVQTSSSLPPQ
jgi:hypothetical protein